MDDYTADDGLTTLTYLGILNLTDDERRIFNEKWNSIYRGDFIGAVWTLYSEILPFTCGDGDRGSFVTQTLRDRDFGRRLKLTHLDERLREGENLKDIFAGSPERFSRLN